MRMDCTQLRGWQKGWFLHLAWEFWRGCYQQLSTSPPGSYAAGGWGIWDTVLWCVGGRQGGIQKEEGR